jgi:serine/threonine protein kinase
MLYHLKKLKLSESILLSILKNILLGLQHLHNLNIAHGDISPYNIMVKSHNGTYFPIIVDFDHSILLDKLDNDNISSFSSGTFGYVPPECAYGIRNDKSDIWALGKTFKFINAHRSGRKINAIIELMIVENHIARPNASDLLDLLS